MGNNNTSSDTSVVRSDGRHARIPTHGSGLGTLFVPKVLYGILLRNVSVQIFAKTKK